ncbi:hypothetical protein ABT275_45870 [Streptomyces sp. NPDC001185]|uniref:hypothetical protein n=1 Tax=Streptomyces sp. NPDC001185 TaxID=3154380 RepID=UPI00332DE5DA
MGRALDEATGEQRQRWLPHNHSGATKNDVYVAPCGNGRSGQFWTADGKYMQNQNHSYLSFSGVGAAIYTVTTLNDATCMGHDYVV